MTKSELISLILMMYGGAVGIMVAVLAHALFQMSKLIGTILWTGGFLVLTVFEVAAVSAH